MTLSAADWLSRYPELEPELGVMLREMIARGVTKVAATPAIDTAVAAEVTALRSAPRRKFLRPRRSTCRLFRDPAPRTGLIPRARRRLLRASLNPLAPPPAGMSTTLAITRRSPSSAREEWALSTRHASSPSIDSSP